MNRQQCEALADELETWMAVNDIHPRSQTLKLLRESLKILDPAKEAPEIAEIHNRLLNLTETEFGKVYHETWNTMRKLDRIVH